MAESLQDELLKKVSSTIIAGDASARDAAQSCLDAGVPIEDVVFKGIFKAWDEFCEWYARDPMGSLKKWLECFNATSKVLKLLESKLQPLQGDATAVLVCTPRGEGHVLMKDIVALLLKSKGFKVYSYRRGLIVDDLDESMGDASLKYAVVSCTQDDIIPSAISLVDGIKARRNNVTVIAGGPMAGQIHADIIAEDVQSLYSAVQKAS